MSFTLRQEADRNRYVLANEEGDVGLATYSERDGKVSVNHTEVLPHMRGKGIGGELAKQVLAAIRASGKTPVGACPFVRDYMDAHPEA